MQVPRPASAHAHAARPWPATPQVKSCPSAVQTAVIAPAATESRGLSRLDVHPQRLGRRSRALELSERQEEEDTVEAQCNIPRATLSVQSMSSVFVSCSVPSSIDVPHDSRQRRRQHQHGSIGSGCEPSCNDFVKSRRASTQAWPSFSVFEQHSPIAALSTRAAPRPAISARRRAGPRAP